MAATVQKRAVECLSLLRARRPSLRSKTKLPSASPTASQRPAASTQSAVQNAGLADTVEAVRHALASRASTRSPAP
jgi:hypothetical protein